MKSKIKFLFVALLAILAISCSESNIGPTVTPPSWKGFNYAVKRAIDGGQAGEYEQIVRGALLPGDEIKVYAVRKNEGKHVGKVSGTIYVRCTIYPESGEPIIKELDKPAISLANSSYTGWEDPYATFTLPVVTEPYSYFKVETACEFYFDAHGNQNSMVDYSDQTSHEGGKLRYHTIYSYPQ